MQLQRTPPFFQEPEQQKTLWWRRKGLFGWWFALTAPERPDDMNMLETREFVRRGEMTSLTILAVFLFLAGIVSNSLSDPSTAEAAVVMAGALVISAVFNRLGRITVAAYILVSFMMAVIMLSIVEARGGLRLIWFTTYDLFCVPVFFSSLIIHRRASPICACLAIAFIVGDYTFHPHALITSALGAHNFDELKYEVQQPFFNVWALINRNVLLVLFAGFFGWAAAYSFEKALVWAEQAKGEAAVANALAEYKEMTAQQLSQFLSELVEVFVAQANGSGRLLRTRPPGDPFFQASLLLNERLRRFEYMRRQNQTLSATPIKQAVLRLSSLLTQITQGNVGVRTLEEFHTEVEEVNMLARQFYALLKPLYVHASDNPMTPAPPSAASSPTRPPSGPFPRGPMTGPIPPVSRPRPPGGGPFPPPPESTRTS